jgi:hypothetical protein
MYTLKKNLKNSTQKKNIRRDTHGTFLEKEINVLFNVRIYQLHGYFIGEFNNSAV